MAVAACTSLIGDGNRTKIRRGEEMNIKRITSEGVDGLGPELDLTKGNIAVVVDRHIRCTDMAQLYRDISAATGIMTRIARHLRAEGKAIVFDAEGEITRDLYDPERDLLMDFSTREATETEVSFVWGWVTSERPGFLFLASHQQHHRDLTGDFLGRLTRMLLGREETTPVFFVLDEIYAFSLLPELVAHGEEKSLRVAVSYIMWSEFANNVTRGWDFPPEALDYFSSLIDIGPFDFSGDFVAQLFSHDLNTSYGWRVVERFYHSVFLDGKLFPDTHPRRYAVRVFRQLIEVCRSRNTASREALHELLQLPFKEMHEILPEDDNRGPWGVFSYYHPEAVHAELQRLTSWI